MDGGFMEMACSFLDCKKGGLPFKYLGLPVGAIALVILLLGFNL